MILWGTIVNALAIVIGGLAGSAMPRISEGIRKTVMQAIGLAVVILGITMSLKSQMYLLLVASLVIGGIIGELLRLELLLQRLGAWLEGKFGTRGKGRIATGFVTATLVYCIGPMAILGALDGGLRHDHDILYTKAMLDGFSAVIFASTLGVGVMISAFPVFIYQGLIAVSAGAISLLLSHAELQQVIAELTGVGGVLIIALGLDLLELVKIRVANLLPSLLIAALGVPLIDWFSRLSA